MELRHLRYFVAVAEERSFTKAAQRLHVAQPPLSLQIQRLEQELGASLFDRSTQPIELTEAGRVLLDDARDVLLRASAAGNRARRAARGEIGRLTIGFIGSAGHEILPTLVRAYRAERPEVELIARDLSTAEQIAALHTDAIDVGIVRPPLSDAAISLQRLIAEPYWVALPEDHALARRKRIEIALLKDEPFVMEPQSIAPGFHDQMLGMCRKHGFLPSIRYEVAKIHVTLDLVAAGLGVAIIPASVSRLRAHGIVYRPIKDSAVAEISIAVRHDDQSAVVAEFRRLASRLYPARPAK
jgi:DNA-binding transcriptional LysR family regulator